MREYLMWIGGVLLVLAAFCVLAVVFGPAVLDDSLKGNPPITPGIGFTAAAIFAIPGGLVIYAAKNQKAE